MGRPALGRQNMRIDDDTCPELFLRRGRRNGALAGGRCWVGGPGAFSYADVNDP